MRCAIVKIIQTSLIRLLSPKLSSAISLGFDMASMVCKMSVRCLRSSYRLHRWVLYLPTTTSGTDLVSSSVCIMLSGLANALITAKPIFSFFCNAPLGVTPCKRNEVWSSRQCALVAVKRNCVMACIIRTAAHRGRDYYYYCYYSTLLRSHLEYCPTLRYLDTGELLTNRSETRRSQAIWGLDHKGGRISFLRDFSNLTG